NALRGKLAFAGKVPAGAAGLIVATAVVSVGLGAGLYAINEPNLPDDPRFQAGIGTYPAANGATPAGQTGADWPHFGGDQGGQRYSPLDQITLANVGNLAVAWEVDVGRIPANNSVPL